jgi:hypothetical protein
MDSVSAYAYASMRGIIFALLALALIWPEQLLALAPPEARATQGLDKRRENNWADHESRHVLPCASTITRQSVDHVATTRLRLLLCRPSSHEGGTAARAGRRPRAEASAPLVSADHVAAGAWQQQSRRGVPHCRE